ncbi:tight adherence pilus pseudopilin TadF [Vibrio metschnikovii]|uniref:tight adherence pilus pseudopilin TadF n=1 Tax=Vibrio metschnikovii TaxID=28172 RepID=UPI001C30ABFE|nr:tight adherence pilus pseudopilin TadF [Vibrio metschnikovii]
MKTSLVKQHGNFMVEFAIVGVFFALLLIFSADLVVRLAYQGKLDRMSYSAANIIKERTELEGADQFGLRPDKVGENGQEELGEFSLLYQIVTSSLARTTTNFDESKFGFHLHIVNNNNNISGPYYRGGINCNPSMPPADLTFTTTFGRPATLYQVTLCYDTPNWYGNLIGEDFKRVSSRAVVMGR